MQRKIAVARDITGLVLAGGQGQRMGGVDKGWIEYAGRPLIEIVCERLAPQVADLLISANRSTERYARLAPVVVDQPEAVTLQAFAGPLAGILSGLRKTERDWIAVVPCDAPHLPLDLIARLAPAAVKSGVACASVQGRLQPLFVLAARDSIDGLLHFLATGGRAAHSWIETHGAAVVEFEDPLKFVNINTPTDAGRAA